MSGPILVTGAGGFIGRAIVGRLRAAGLPVRAGLRSGQGGPEALTCDLDRPETLAPALAGAGAIVHAAYGAIDRMPDQLRALLAAAERDGIPRVVLFSSVAVYGTREGLVAEDAEPEGPPEPYGGAKRACEAILRDWVVARNGRAAVILRPGLVYGPGSRLWIERPLAALRAGALATLGPAGDGIAPLVHVADVAEATRLALAALLDASGPTVTDLAVNLAGPDEPRWNDYLQALADADGLGPLRRIGPVELRIGQALARPAKLLRRLGLPSPDRLALAPSAGELRLFRRRAVYDATAAAKRLGWRPAISLAEGLALSLPSRARPRNAGPSVTAEAA